MIGGGVSIQAGAHLSVNHLVVPRLSRLLSAADALGLTVHKRKGQVTFIDGGIEARGSAAAGARIAEVCMAGLGAVQPGGQLDPGWPSWTEVRSVQPVIACLASQHAGWRLEVADAGDGLGPFRALASGPARSLACTERVFADLGYSDEALEGVLLLETDRRPPDSVVERILSDCGLDPEGLTLILAPINSMTGMTQRVARVMEIAIYRAYRLGFPMDQIVDGRASVPQAVPSPDMTVSTGRAHDAVIYGGRVHLRVKCEDEQARELAMKLPSLNSSEFGQTFEEVYLRHGGDTSKVDPALIAPAEVWISNLLSGRTWRAGGLRIDLLNERWVER